MSKESQKEFYHQQRLKAEKSGDTKTTTKIYDKLNAAQYGESQKLRDAKKDPDANSPDQIVAKAKAQGQDFVKSIFGGK